VKYVIFDTETGGLDPATDAIVSLGAVAWDSELGRLPAPEFYAVVNDVEGNFHPRALEVNGFTVDRIRADGRPAHEVWEDFVGFSKTVGGSSSAPVLLGGHNTGFDVGFLKRLARLSGAAEHYEAVFSHRTVCTMNTVRFLCLAGVLRPGLGGLTQCVDELGIERQEFHNALGDARMAADLLTKLVEIARPKAGSCCEYGAINDNPHVCKV